MISDLDRRGYHDEARRNYDAFLHYQGTVSLPGNFKSEGGPVLRRRRPRDGRLQQEPRLRHVGHGRALALHPRPRVDGTRRPRAWSRPASGSSANGRPRWLPGPTARRPIEYGFLPAGGLEDVRTTGTGWRPTARRSGASGRWPTRWPTPATRDGTRLQEEAEAYHDDFMRGIDRIARSAARWSGCATGPTCRRFPRELYDRGRAHGWIRETLEGSMFLPAYGLLAPDAPETRWILKDYEDNLYISDRYGYSIPAFDEFWFSRGGFSMQANLLDGPLPYL